MAGLVFRDIRYDNAVYTGMTKYITGRTGLTGAIVDTDNVCKYYIGPSVACLFVLSAAAATVAVATQWRADRRRRPAGI